MRPTDAFLDAVDEVLNSNTFLLVLPAPPPRGEDVHTLEQTIASPAFREALLAADRAREWDLFHTWGPDGTPEPTDASLVRPVPLQVVRLSDEALRERLVSMLIAGGEQGFTSPYHKERPRSVAEALVDGLLAAREPSSRSYRVAPDFLFHHGEQGGAGYRDGLGSDSVTAWVGPTTVAVLLTNGMA